MDKNSFELLYKDAGKALGQNHLTDALTCIRGLLFNADSMELKNELESIRQDYGMMLAFMRQGGDDPQRDLIHRSLLNRASVLLDKSARNFRISTAHDIYTETLRRLGSMPDGDFDSLSTKADLLRESREGGMPTDEDREKAFYESYDLLFDCIWTSPISNKEEADRLTSFIERQAPRGQAMLIGAVMLGVQQYFDPQKFRLLLHFCRAEDATVRARALTAAVLAYIQYAPRFRNYPDLCDGLAMLAQDERLKDELILLQRQLLLSRDTDKAKKKLQDEIFPDLLKHSNYQRNKMGLGQMEEDLAKALQGEPNAEWEKSKGNKQLADNMKAIIAMGQEGVDINIGTFSALKGFPFFQKPAHWFAPFDEHRPEVASIFPQGSNNNPVRLLMDTGAFCDSDKYSLCMMFNQIPASQKEMMMSQIGTQIGGHEETLKDAAKESLGTVHIYRSCLQDLYRFYKLFPGHAQFNDPFRHDLLFTRHDVLGTMLKNSRYLADMASFLIRRECHQDAIEYLEEVLRHETADAETLQKVAFCYQHTGNPSKAIYYYQQADLLNPDNEWILKQMYLCHAALGRHELELGCLEKLVKINPGDARLISETGLCLMQLGRYEEAANRFYELEYKGERVLPSWRAIAWCNFKMGKLEQADKYYRKILQHEKATWEDYLNAGHTAWCRKQTPEAVALYRQYIERYRQKKNAEGASPLKPFDDDREELLQHGIPSLDIDLMHDLLQPAPAE